MAHQMGIAEAERCLGLGERFDEADLRRAYVSFAHAWHPDLVSARGGDVAEANGKMAMANTAQAVLAEAIRSGAIQAEPMPAPKPRSDPEPQPAPKAEPQPQPKQNQAERRPADKPFVVMFQKFLLGLLGAMLVIWFAVEFAGVVFPYGEVSPTTILLAVIQDVLLLPILALLVFVAAKVFSFLRVAAGWLVGASEDHRLFAVFADIALVVAILLFFLCFMPGGPHYTPDEAFALLGLS